MFALAAIATASAAPQASDIELLLQRTEFCVASIDACLDGEGKQIIPNSVFKVRNIVCRRVAKPVDRNVTRSMSCRFDVEQTSWVDDQQIGSGSVFRSSGTFDQFKSKMAGQTEYYWRQRRKLNS